MQENSSPIRSSPNLEYDYSEEKQKTKLETNFNNLIETDKRSITSWKFDETKIPLEVKYIPFNIPEKKISKHPTIKKLYQEDEENIPIKKTKFNLYFKFIFKHFFTKKELFKFIQHVTKENELDFFTYIEVRKVKSYSSKASLIDLCTNLINKIAYK